MIVVYASVACSAELDANEDAARLGLVQDLR